MVKNFLSILLIAAPFATILAQGPQQLVSSTFTEDDDTFKTTYTYSKKSRVVKPLTGLFLNPYVHYDESEITPTLKFHNADTAICILNNSDTMLQVNTYDATHKLTQTAEQNSYYNGLHTYTYHTNGTIKKSTTSFRSKNGSSIRLYETTFHDDGRYDVEKTIDSSSNRYIIYNRHYEYNANKQLTREYYDFDTIYTNGSSWGFSEYDYTYTGATAPYSVVKKAYNLNFDGVNWEPRTLSRTEYYDYNAQNKMSRDSSINVNSSNSNVFKYFYNGNQVKIDYVYYSGNTPSTENTSIQELNSAGNLIQDRYWETMDTALAPKTNKVYTYNAQNLMTEYKFIKWDNGVFTTYDSISVTFNASNNLVTLVDVRNDNTITCEYQAAQGEEDPVGLEQLTNFAAKVYPNPVQGVLNLDIELADYDVVLYNASGVLLGHYNNVKSLDFTYRPTGSYIINVIDNKTGAAVAKTIFKN